MIYLASRASISSVCVQGVEIKMKDGARIIIREVEYPMTGVDIHIYVEDIEEKAAKIHNDPKVCTAFLTIFDKSINLEKYYKRLSCILHI